MANRNLFHIGIRIIEFQLIIINIDRNYDFLTLTGQPLASRPAPARYSGAAP